MNSRDVIVGLCGNIYLPLTICHVGSCDISCIILHVPSITPNIMFFVGPIVKKNCLGLGLVLFSYSFLIAKKCENENNFLVIFFW